jgi:very-short-patch-repair endonuclease
MPTYRPRPRRHVPPPLAGGGEQSSKAIVRGRGRARQLRTEASEAEQKLWYFLRRKQVNGLRFRRQFPLGPYFADFVCLPARLVIEVDGSQHGDFLQAAHEARRTAWLNSNNFRVVRFWADEVMANPASILDAIDGVLREPLPRRFAPPPPARGGGL